MRKRGRPRVPDENSSERTRQRRAKELRLTYSQEILSKAVQPIQNQPKVKVNNVEPITDDFANTILAMYMDVGLTRNKYETLRTHNILFKDKLLPSYETILSAKKMLSR